MCLDTITKTGLNKSGYGWKVFRVNTNGVLYNECRDTEDPKLINRWLIAKKQRIRDIDYMSGFHIFLSRKSAVAWQDDTSSIIQRVKYRKGRIIGKQLISKKYRTIIVADEMLILPLKAKKGRA